MDLKLTFQNENYFFREEKWWGKAVKLNDTFNGQ